jgi:FKBP-type peptidyl-prolyl cis-trans isomerase FkpA
VVVAAFDDVDGVDLDVAQMRHGGRGGLRASAERFRCLQPLGMKPDAAGLGGADGDVRWRHAGKVIVPTFASARAAGPIAAVCSFMSLRALLLLLFLPSATVLTAQSRVDSTATQAWVRSPSGLEYQIVTVGQGRPVASGDTVTIHEALSLVDGRIIFDSRKSSPVTFLLGAKQVIPGVEEGVTGMRVGERRRLRVPPALDGRTFDPSFIPVDAVRLYDIELLSAKP